MNKILFLMRKLFCHEEISRRTNLETNPKWANRNGTMIKKKLEISFQFFEHWIISVRPLYIFRFKTWHIKDIVLDRDFFLKACGFKEIILNRADSPSFTTVWTARDETLNQKCTVIHRNSIHSKFHLLPNYK